MASITLAQDRVYTAPGRFGTLERVTTSDPTLLASSFLIERVAGTQRDRERLVRVATFTDLVAGDGNGLFSANPLTYFKDNVVNITTKCIVGDTITLTTPPDEWQNHSSFNAYNFVVKALDAPNQRVEVTVPFIWYVPAPAAAGTGLAWQIYRNAVQVAGSNGVDGFTARSSDSPTRPFLDDRFLSYFRTSIEALNHLAAVKYWMELLASSSGLDGTEYLAYNGISNPQNTTLVG